MALSKKSAGYHRLSLPCIVGCICMRVGRRAGSAGRPPLRVRARRSGRAVPPHPLLCCPPPPSLLRLPPPRSSSPRPPRSRAASAASAGRTAGGGCSRSAACRGSDRFLGRWHGCCLLGDWAAQGGRAWHSGTRARAAAFGRSFSRAGDVLEVNHIACVLVANGFEHVADARGARWDRVAGFERFSADAQVRLREIAAGIPRPPCGPPPAPPRVLRQPALARGGPGAIAPRAACDSAAKRVLARAYRAVRTVPLSPAPTGGPRKSIASGAHGAPSPAAIQDSLARARALAIVGSAPRSFGSWRAAVRAWMAFAQRRLNKDGCSALPPSPDEVCLFALEFRNPRTFGNYVAQLKKACQLLGRDASAFSHPSVRGARKAIGRRHPMRRPLKPFVLLSHLSSTLDFVSADSTMCALFLVSWGFALRVPSEALLVERGDPLAFKDFAFSDQDLRRPRARVVLFFSGAAATMHFSRRKNRDGPTVAARSCWCAHSPATCTVHAARAFSRASGSGRPRFRIWGGRQ